MTDYYKLLNVDPSASTEEIQAAIKKTRRLWNTRSTNPNADIRAEAEQNIRDIAEAEKILLDPSERAQYDVALSQKGNSAPSTSSNQQNYDDNSWIDQADYFRRKGDYYSLISLAQSVINAQPQNYMAWYILGDAHYNQENHAEAEKCLRQSVRLNPNDMAYESLGFLYLDRDMFYDAYDCFSKAMKLDPDTANYKFEVAETLRLMNKLDEALSMVETAYKQNPNVGSAKAIYFSCLRDLIYNAVSYNRSSGRHLIINPRQLEFVKKYLPKLSSMVINDRKDHVKVENELRQMVIAAEATHGFFSKPGYVKNYEMSNADTRKTGLQ